MIEHEIDRVADIYRSVVLITRQLDLIDQLFLAFLTTQLDFGFNVWLDRLLSTLTNKFSLKISPHAFLCYYIVGETLHILHTPYTT